jgi:tetratricopeptide (TPR) repeat protein
VLERALAILEKRKEQDPAHLKLLAASLVNLALIRETAPVFQGRHLPGAESLAERGLKVLEKMSAPDDPEFAAGLVSLAMVYQTQNRSAEAEALVKRALPILEKTRGPDHFTVATSLGILATVYQAQNRSTEAAPLFKRAVTSLEKTFGPNYHFIAILLMTQILLANHLRQIEVEQAGELLLA